MFQFSWKTTATALLFAGATKAQYNENDLAAHSSSGNCWTVVSGGVYGKTVTPDKLLHRTSGAKIYSPSVLSQINTPSQM